MSEITKLELFLYSNTAGPPESPAFNQYVCQPSFKANLKPSSITPGLFITLFLPITENEEYSF